MAAHHNINPDQLKMFMTGREITDMLEGTIDSPHLSVDEVMDYSLTESKKKLGTGHGSGVHASVKKEGVRNPVQLVHTDWGVLMGHGKHRVAAAEDIDYQSGKQRYIPVIHTEAGKGSPIEMTQPPIIGDVDERRAALRDLGKAVSSDVIGEDIAWKMKSNPGMKKKQR